MSDQALSQHTSETGNPAAALAYAIVAVSGVLVGLVIAWLV